MLTLNLPWTTLPDSQMHNGSFRDRIVSEQKQTDFDIYSLIKLKFLNVGPYI